MEKQLNSTSKFLIDAYFFTSAPNFLKFCIRSCKIFTADSAVVRGGHYYVLKIKLAKFFGGIFIFTWALQIFLLLCNPTEDGEFAANGTHRMKIIHATSH